MQIPNQNLYGTGSILPNQLQAISIKIDNTNNKGQEHPLQFPENGLLSRKSLDGRYRKIHAVC